jgi:hypothetical protein
MISDSLTVVVMMSSVFWDMIESSSLKVNQYFEGTCCLRLQGRRISQIRNQHESGSKHSFLGIFIDLEDGGEMFL